jgi:ABC-type maltose transport system permease subunit
MYGHLGTVSNELFCAENELLICLFICRFAIYMMHRDRVQGRQLVFSLLLILISNADLLVFVCLARKANGEYKYREK